MPAPPGSTLFHNGRILTGEDLLAPGGSPRFVSALLVERGLITAAGSRAELQPLCTPATTHVDLEDAFCMPGFNDAHLHLGEGARLRREVDLRGTRSLADMLSRIEAAANASPAEEAADAWLSGGGWDESLWPEARLPSRHDLDRVTGNRPAVFARCDVHISIANSAALRLAGVTRDTPAPPASAIDRDPASDPSGEPTGILRERAARDLVERHLPPATLAVRAHHLLAILHEAAAHGITSVQDYSVAEDFAALGLLHREGAAELPVRISEWLPFDLPIADLQALRASAPQDRFLRTTMLKAFLDGSLGSRTAALLAPYSDADSTGLPLYEPETLTTLALERAAAGFQLGFHAIGDRAFRMALDTFAAVAHAGTTPSLPFRIEHAQLAFPGAFRQAHDLGVLASMQPSHLLSDLPWVAARLGPARSALSYAWRSMRNAGVPLAFGTDFPVEPISPFRGLYAAVTRQSETGSLPPFYPEQTIRMAEALHAYTAAAAYAEGSDSWKGLLRPGYVADFIALDRDLLAPELLSHPERILDTRVLRTVLNGQVIFHAESHAGPLGASGSGDALGIGRFAGSGA